MAVPYPCIVRCVRSCILMAALSFGAILPCSVAQQKAQPNAPKDQMFSGEVTAIDSSSLTATRTGSKDSRTFVITAETRFEGKPRVSSRVTIRYIVTEEGARAVRIIVRPPAKK
jgi:hypothetical protein